MSSKPIHTRSVAGASATALLVASAFLSASFSVRPGDGTVWSADDPAINTAIQRGVAYLRQNIDKERGGRLSLAAYALLKAGHPANSAEITRAVDQIRSKIKDGAYQPASREQHIYEAGIDLMLLADVDAERNLTTIEAITQYIIAQQGEKGDWDYPERTVGDTSITQYGILGLWSAARSGVDVPQSVWSKAAAWHLATQQKDGGFAYHPGLPVGPEKGASTQNLTNAGTASLLLAKMYLYPSASSDPLQKRKQQAAPPNSKFKFGVLEQVELDSAEKKKKPEPDSSAKVGLSQINQSVDRGMTWIETRFLPYTTNVNKTYYYYTLERLAALADLERIGTHDWFNECLEVVLKTQEPDGSWQDFTSPTIGTSFALLFLTRATAKTLGRAVGPSVGSGLLSGGRGLPDNLDQVQVKGGKVEVQKTVGPLDELLKQLENPQVLNVESTQTAIVEAVQIGDREALVGQTERLEKLVNDRRPEVRRTAVWALGRGGDLRHAFLLLKALKDPDLDVVIEAGNALCVLSRKPRGLGLPDSPLNDVPEDATEQQRLAAIEKWRAEMVKRWTDWYLSIRPYEERDNLLEAELP